MIYVELYGRLGNNMFQMAAAATLAKRNGTRFLPIAREEMWINFLEPFYDNVLRKLPRPQLNTDEFAVEYKEIDHFYHTIPFQDGMLLKGYYQSYKYFDQDYIRDLFSPSDEIKEEIYRKYPILKSEMVTSINVRRGDYLQVIDTFPVCGMNYYDRAIKKIGSKGYFIVTSDDIRWCKKHFKKYGDNFIFVENVPTYIDFYIPTLCKNNIISNGTFSWWGAFLNVCPNKRVIKPQYWFHSFDRRRLSDIDLIPPENWEVVSNRMELRYYKLFIQKYYKNRFCPYIEGLFRQEKASGK